MAKQTRSLEFHDGISNKFWTLTLEGSKHVVEFGRVGTKGQEQTKAFDSPEAARVAFDKLVAEKLKKGYHDAGTTAVAAAVEPEAAAAPAAQNAGLRGALKKLEAFLKETDPEMRKALRSAATPKQLEKLSKAVFPSSPLPADLAEWFGWHNGQKDEGELLIDRTFTLLSIEEAIEEFEGMRGFDPGPGVPKRWGDDWLPLLSNGGGDYMAFVTGAREQGAIKEFWHDDDDDEPVETEFRNLQALAEAALEMREEAEHPTPAVTVKLDLSKAVPLMEITPQIAQQAAPGTIYFGKGSNGYFKAILQSTPDAWWSFWDTSPLEKIVQRVIDMAQENNPMRSRSWPAAVSYAEDILKSNPDTARVAIAQINSRKE
jgi:predicted DNA-binding WGR domain protein/cell wall assembly regulator SMI1